MGVFRTAVPEAYRRFYKRFGKRIALNGGAQADELHEALLSSAFDVKKSTVNRRRASISVDGTPVVYSLQLPLSANRPSFRLLCEPGGLGITIPEQIDFSRRTMQAITERLGWGAAQMAVDEILARVIPCEPAAMSDWWGGIWIGAAMQSDTSEVRIYANLRHGELISRWQRVANVLAPFADQRLIPTVREWMDTAGRVAIPVGVGMVLSESGVPVVRIYLGVEKPCLDAIRTARGQRFSNSDVPIAEFCEAFVTTYGPFHRQSMTLGFDFVSDDEGLFRPEIARFKVDVSFGHIKATSQPSPDAFIADQIENAFPVAIDSYHAFRDDLAECFGGSDVEYVSLASRGDRLSEMTIYARPHKYSCN